MTKPPKCPRDEEHMQWGRMMPAIRFPHDWYVTIIPPFGGAAVRFTVQDKTQTAEVSVFADFDSSLTPYYDESGQKSPCWEVWPYGDCTWKTSIEDVEGLLKAIEESFIRQMTSDTGKERE